MRILEFTYRSAHRIKKDFLRFLNHLYTWMLFRANGVRFSTFRTGGRPYVVVNRGGNMCVGIDFAMNNGLKNNIIGIPQPCTFFVKKDCCLTIGNHVGISQSALIAHADITIGDNVKIGGGTCVYTTDFHSLDPRIRIGKEDYRYSKKAPVVIEDNVFIGAKCIILKGVIIGKNSIVGAGSVVTKSIPENEIWAGNPAHFVRKV